MRMLRAPFGFASDMVDVVSTIRRMSTRPDQAPAALVALRGGSWTMGAYGASQLFRLITQVFLAQLLDPSAFGLVALVNVFLSGLEMLSDLGLSMHVVRHPRGDDPHFINTAYLIQAGRGILLFALAAALASPFSTFYAQPAVRALVIVAALSTLIRGFASGSIWSMTRHLNLKELALLNIASDVSGFALSLAWAAVSPTPWALVAGRVMSAVAFTIGSHLVGDRRVKFEWDAQAAREALVFGKAIAISTATYFLCGEAERLIVAKMITAEELGCLSLALALSAVAPQALGQVTNQVFYPIISKSLRENEVKALTDYVRARAVFLLLSLILGVGLVAYGPKVVSLLLPSRYAMTGWMLQWLGWRAAQEVYCLPAVSYTLARGDPGILALTNGVRLVFLLAGLTLAARGFGLQAAVPVLALSGALAYSTVLLPNVRKHLGSVAWREVSGFALFVTVTSLVALAPSLGW